MKKNLGYIVLAASGSIYILYNFIVTSILLYRTEGRLFNIWDTFFAEIVAFIPVGIFFVGMLMLKKKRNELFDKFSLKSISIHCFILLIFISTHSAWQVFFNSILISGAEFSTVAILRDALYFLNLRVLVYVITVGLVIGVNQIEEKENFELKESELKLKLQKAKFRKFELKLNPEIIYPTLTEVRKNAQKNPDRGPKLILNLSKQMRILIDNLDEEHIPIEQDIRFFNYYFENLEIRLERNLIIQSDVDESHLDDKIPPLVLLTPFFEKLFFGDYSRFTKNVEVITYRSKKIRSGLMNLSMDFYSVQDLKKMADEMRNDSHLKEIRNMLEHYRNSSLIIHLTDDRLSIQLNIDLIPAPYETSV
jgi:hypothetical protein